MLPNVRAAFVRVRELFRNRSAAGAEQDEEFRFHMEMETAENARRRMNATEARRAAVLRFGGTQRFREESADARGMASVDTLVRNARFALRRLRRAPAFSAGVIATLGIGIGAAIGIGSIVYGVLLRDLPYHEPDQLVRVGFHTSGLAADGDLHSEATFLHFAENSRSFSELGAYYTIDAITITDGEGPERVTAAMITPSVLTLLGARPLLGSLFAPGDTSWSGDRVPILISESLWRRRYGAKPSIIGQRLEINRGTRVVVGVLPQSFDFPSPSSDIYYPTPTRVDRPQITARYFHVIGRLRTGSSAQEAAAELNTLIPTLASRFPAITADLLQRSRARASVTSLKSAIVASVRPQLVLLGVLVGVVLLIATTNVVNLFLLHTERASHEIAIAFSLGATRLMVAQRFVIEGIVLGLLSAFVALPAAALALSIKFGFTEREIPRLNTVSFTCTTVALTLICAVVLGAGVGMTALSRTGLSGLFDRIRGSRSTLSRNWRRAQNGLVAFQVAIALTLLVAAGLLGRSFWNLRNAEIGFEPANATSFQVSLPWNGYRSYAENAAFHARMMDRLAALPGVNGVAAALRLPLSNPGAPTLDMQLEASDDEGRPSVLSAGNMASADFLGVMGIKLRGGRSFAPGDLRGVPAVIVSERLAMSIYGTADVVGRGLRKLESDGTQSTEFTIVGVVGDVHWGRIEDGYVPTVYFPLLRDGDGLPTDSAPVPYRPRDVVYTMRGTQLPTATTIQGIVMDLDRLVAPTHIRTLESLVDTATARVRLTMLLIAVAGAAALLLGVIGVYSVVSYAATGRTREFSIRVALGAAPTRVGRMVLGDGLRLVVIGILAGLVVAVAGMKLLSELLYEVKPTSVPEFALATVLLIAAALLAVVVPARRAARTDPALVLRGE